MKRQPPAPFRFKSSKSKQAVDNALDQWQHEKQSASPDVDADFERTFDKLPLDDLVAAYEDENDRFDADPNNFNDDADFYHAPTRESAEKGADFDPLEIEHTLGRQMRVNNITHGTKPIEIPDDSAPGTRPTAGKLKPTQAFNVEALSTQELLEFEPFRFFPKDRNEALRQQACVMNLEQHLNELSMPRKSGKPVYMTHARLMEWLREMSDHWTSNLHTKRQFPAQRRIVYVYFVDRPIFVHCVFEVLQSKATPPGNPLYRWLGHYYTGGRVTE